MHSNSDVKGQKWPFRGRLRTKNPGIALKSDVLMVFTQPFYSVRLGQGNSTVKDGSNRGFSASSSQSIR